MYCFDLYDVYSCGLYWHIVDLVWIFLFPLLLVLLLIVASLGAWIQSFRVFERAPRAQNIAQQVVSVVNVTRAALLYSDPFVRRDLLAELAANEGIRIYPLEPTDVVVPVMAFNIRRFRAEEAQR